MATKAEKSAREVVRIFRVVLKLEDELQAAHASGNWEKAWQAAVRLRRAIKSSRGLVDRFSDLYARE
jgi:hypothetical protein